MKRTQGLCTLVPASWSTCYPEILAGSFWGCLQPQSGLLSKVPTWPPGTRCSYEPASHSVQILLVSIWEELSLPDSCPVLFFLASSHFFIGPLPNCSRPGLRIFSFLGFLLLKVRKLFIVLECPVLPVLWFCHKCLHKCFKGKSYSTALKMLSQGTLWSGGFSDLVIPCRPTWPLTSKERDLNFTIEVETHMVMKKKKCERKFMW